MLVVLRLLFSLVVIIVIVEFNVGTTLFIAISAIIVMICMIGSIVMAAIIVTIVIIVSTAIVTIIVAVVPAMTILIAKLRCLRLLITIINYSCRYWYCYCFLS